MVENFKQHISKVPQQATWGPPKIGKIFSPELTVPGETDITCMRNYTENLWTS